MITKSILSDANAVAEDLALITARSPEYQQVLHDADAAFKAGDVDTYLVDLNKMFDMEADFLRQTLPASSED